MPSRSTIAALCSAIALLACAAPCSRASGTWVDLRGNKIEAEPVEALGPFALFDNGALIPFNMLSMEDCVRFYKAQKSQPARSDDWSAATSTISQELSGRLMRFEKDNLVYDDQKGRPEPEFYMVFYATTSEGQAWDMVGKSTPQLFEKLQKSFPGMVQGLIYGVQETLSDYATMASSMRGGWLLTDFKKQVEMDSLRRMIPSLHYGIVVMTRQGVPLFGPDSKNEEEVKAIFDKTTALLDQIRPTNHRGWTSRAHYLAAIQPVIHADSASGPVLVGNPLVADGLRQRKIYLIDATLHVSAQGLVTAVDLKPESVPAGMAAPLADALKKTAVLVPAVDHGKFVDGTYDFHMEVPH